MSAHTITLRHGDARDAGVVDAIMAAAFDPRFGEAWTRNQCVGVMALPGVRLTIASVDDRPAGFALARQVVDEAELLLLAVMPGHRRAGIGGALLRAVMADATDGGAAMLHLEVRATNDAVGLYERHGFRRLGVRPGYYRGKGGEVNDAHSYGRALDRV